MFFFPFSTLHELNLDWILAKMKHLLSTEEENKEKADYAVETAEEAKEIAEQAAQGQIGDGAVTTAKLADNAVTSAKLSVPLQDKLDEIDTLSDTIDSATIGRVNNIAARWHVDCISGDDNDTGASGHAWKTLDKFFSMANSLKGKGDIRCYLDAPGNYPVSVNTETDKTYTGFSFHITGGLNSDAVYDGNYVIQFLNVGETKFYISHVNFRNVKMVFPYSSATNKFSLDGGNFSIKNCLIEATVNMYGTNGVLENTTIESAKIYSSIIHAANLVTTSTTVNQYVLNENSSLFYSGSISGGSLLTPSSLAAFNITASHLFVSQAYPAAGTESITGSNSAIYASIGRAAQWKAKAGTLSNTLWITSDSLDSYVAGDVYNLALYNTPVAITGGAKSLHFTATLPKTITANTATITSLLGAIRMPTGGYLSDGSEGSASSDWTGGTNIENISDIVISQNCVSFRVNCRNIPTYGNSSTPVTNNSFAEFEGAITIQFS